MYSFSSLVAIIAAGEAPTCKGWCFWMCWKMLELNHAMTAIKMSPMQCHIQSRCLKIQMFNSHCSRAMQERDDLAVGGDWNEVTSVTAPYEEPGTSLAKPGRVAIVPQVLTLWDRTCQTLLSSFTCFNSVNLHAQFTDDKTEADRGQGTFPELDLLSTGDGIWTQVCVASGSDLTIHGRI